MSGNDFYTTFVFVRSLLQMRFQNLNHCIHKLKFIKKNKDLDWKF